MSLLGVRLQEKLKKKREDKEEEEKQERIKREKLRRTQGRDRTSAKQKYVPAERCSSQVSMSEKCTFRSLAISKK